MGSRSTRIRRSGDLCFDVAGVVAQMLGKAPDLRKFSAADLEQAVCRAGFTIVESGDFAIPARYIVARKPGGAA